MYKLTALLSALLFTIGCVQDAAIKPAEKQNVINEKSISPFPVKDEKPISVVVNEPSGTLKLADALSLTLMRNPELKAFSYEMRAAGARQLQAGLWANPELSFEMEDIGGTGVYNDTDSAETTIQLSQLIQLGGKVKKSRESAAYKSRLATIDYQSKRLDVFSELSQSFVELLFVQQKKELSQELIKNSEEVIESVSKRVKAGKDAPLDLSKAKISLANARIGHLEIVRAIDYNRKKLTSFWNNPNPEFSDLAGDLEEIATVEKVDKLVSLLDNNPDVARWAIEVQKRNAQKQLADSEALPNLTISGGIKRFSSSNDDAYVIGLSMPLPVFNSNQGGRIEARENIRKARELEQAAYMNVRNELNQIHSELESTYAKIDIFRRDILPAAEEIFQASKTSYSNGKSDYLTLLDSQRTYFSSKNDYIDTLAKYHILRIQLQRLIGQDVTAK